MNYGRLGENENMSSNSTLETNSNNRKKPSSPSTMSTSTSILTDLKQLNLLLWKNYLLQKRSIIGTILEILVPALFVIILLPIRTIVRSDYHPDDSVFDEYTIDALPSSLLPPFNYDDDSLSFSSRAGLWTFAYAPNNTDLVNRVMEKVGDSLNMNIVGNMRHSLGFENEQLMVDFLDDPVNYKLRLGGASFLSQQVENFTYAIRLSYSPRNSGQTGPFKKDMDWKTKFIYSLFPILGPRERGQEEGGDPGYYREGFISIQKSIDFALIEELGGDKFSSNSLINSLELSLKRFPYPPYNDDKFVVVIAALFPFIIMLTFVFTVIITAKSIVYEKETGLKEAMKLMGMKPWIYWLSWYIKTFALLLPAIIFMSVAFKLKINIKYGGSAAIVDKTDPFMFALFLFLYASSSITFTFLCTTFFKKANSAAAGTGVIWFFTYLPYVFIALRYEKMNLAEKVLALFLNNLAMSEGVQLIGMFEGKGTGIDFHNWTSGLSVDDNFSMFMVMTVMFLNNFTHLTLAYYFESIRPGDHGLAKPWYFPLTSLKRLIVCCCCRFTSRKQSRLETYVNEPINGHDAAKTILNTEDNHMAVHIEDEANYAGKPVGIKITSLTKCFEQFGKVKKAVNDLSLNIYEGQISVLLGHNGAGKSTTISMITGLTEPTNGKILINDIDIVEKTREARKFIGFCPQHNLLFDDMTVYEHLKFFAKLKNNFDEKEIDNMLEIINLADKKHALSKNLSGGMKRKLSVAIAFIGKSSIVILDEPSSGMDPQARHSTWSLLQKFKKERKCTILLTTHFMDEADFLGDRIAIMSRGSLRCCGSPLFLKSKYSSGYNLVLTKRQLDSAAANEDESTTNNNNDDKTTNEAHHTTSYETGNRIRNLIQSILPEAALNENLNSEISFVLPSEKTGKFSELFEKLEENKQYLNIDNIGISISTLEDVFLKIGNTEDCEEEEGDNEVAAAGAEEDANNDHPGSLHAAMANGVGQYEPDDHGLWIGSNSNDLVSGFEHIILQFQALLTKRLIHSLRNKTLVIAQIIIPIGVLIINLLSLRYGPIQPEDSPALPIDLIRYSHNYVPFTVVSPNQTTQNITEFMRQLAGLFAQTVDSRSNSKAFEINRTDVINLCTDSRDTIEHLISCLGRLNFEYIADTFILGTEFNASIMDRPKIVAHFNNQPFHVPPLALTQVSNALLKFVLNSSNSSILTINHPLPRTAHDELNDLAIKDATGFNVASGISFGFSFLIASFAIFLIKERASNSKHIQYLSGCNSNVFWISAFLWDMLNYFIPLVFVIILLKLFGIKEYVDEGRWVYMFALLFLYGLSHIPQMYLFSYFFSVSATGFASLVAWNILSSQMTLVPVQILSLPQLDLIDVSNMLEWIFLLLFPNFSIGQSLADFYNNYQVARICRNITEYCAFFPNPCCYNYDPTNPNRCGNGTSCFVWTDNFMQWERPGLLRFFVFMPVQFVVQFGLVLIYEAGYIRWVLYRLRRLFSPGAKSTPSLEVNHQQLAIELEYGDISKDEDVSNEETRISELVNSGSHKNESCKEIFIIDRLAKHYAGGFMAVKGISFSLQHSECFGLLGVNGAGKTTTFKMLTGDEIITSGDAYLNHVNLKQDIKKFQSQVGYCPQFDPLIDQMTVLETMKMFAYLRGIKPRLVKQTCLSLISLLDLTEHMSKMCYTLSGGNKRKLAVAVSLIGSPSVVLLDEPTSGMDPRTRRTLWNCLNQIRNHGKSLILTTHAMDETEVLCTNIGIMVNGELKCLGSLQHLKSKYGEGYTLLAKINLASSSSSSANHHTNNNSLTVNVNDDVPSTSTQSNNTTTTTTTLIKDKTDKFVEFVLSRFDRGELKESRDGFVNIHISDNSTRLLSSLFSLVESVKNEFSIEYYVVTQTNLEQIFLNFASKQIQPETRFVKNRKRFFCF